MVQSGEGDFMNTKKLITIDYVTTELYSVFDKFNQTFFNNELPQTALTIQSTKHKKKNYGLVYKKSSMEF